MKAEFKVNVAAILILAVGVAFFFWFNKKKNMEIDLHLNTISDYEFRYKFHQSEVDSAIITLQKALNASNESLKEALAYDSIQNELIARYKRLSTIIKYETEYIHDTVKVSVPIYIKSDTTVNLSDNCFQASLSLFNGGLSINDYTIDNRQDIVIGEQRSWLSRQESTITIRNTNPCINTTGVQSYNVVYEKKWWENPIITTVGGFIGGWTVAKLAN